MEKKPVLVSPLQEKESCSKGHLFYNEKRKKKEETEVEEEEGNGPIKKNNCKNIGKTSSETQKDEEEMAMIQILSLNIMVWTCSAWFCDKGEKGPMDPFSVEM